MIFLGTAASIGIVGVILDDPTSPRIHGHVLPARPDTVTISIIDPAYPNPIAELWDVSGQY